MGTDHVLELGSLATEDHRRLDALHYRSEATSTIIIHVHGKGGNFYSGPGRFLPPHMATDAIDHLSINMRFHDLAYTRNDYEGGETTAFGTDGGMWESIAHGHLDLRAATDWAIERGYERVYVSGHSAGGYYVGVHGAEDDRIAGRILLSPLQDHKFVLSHWFPENDQLEKALDRARQMVVDGCGHHLIPVNGWFYAISAVTLIERASQPDGVWLKAINGSETPVLLVWGTLESRHELWAQLFEQFEAPGKRSLAIPGCDHFFIGHEPTVADAIRGFIEEH